MRQGIVKYDHLIAGTITETNEGLYVFQYEEQYIQDFPDQFITFQMPVRSQRYHSNTLFPFFDGLIPEGWLLSIASKSWKLSQNDRMGLLLACCRNCIGAVSVHSLTTSKNE